MDMGRHWEEFKPAVDRTILVLIAGMVWVAVGIVLSWLAIIWWTHYKGSFLFIFIFLGLLLGVVKGYFVFSRIVRKNISRIAGMRRPGFVLAFIPARTYLLIACMMAAGITLRHSTLPKQYLAILYLAVGLAMIFSGFLYFKSLLRGNFDQA